MEVWALSGFFLVILLSVVPFFIVFSSQVTLYRKMFAVELDADTKMQKRRQRLMLLLLGSAPCREADIKSCIVLVCLYACPSVCARVCVLIDWLTQLYSAQL